jgi:HTH-type transcriptional regulator, sugar sensing transcriptional regulator
MADRHNELVSLGLTGYEARTYLALISRDRYTAAQLARESGVPRQRIYDVLAALTERGLVRPLPGRLVRYTAVDPASAIERLMAAHRAEFSRLEQVTAGLVEALVPAWTHGREETDPLDYVEVIRDQEILVDRFEELLAEADHEILSIAKLPYVISDNPTSLDTARRLTANGGRVRAIYESAALEDPSFVAELGRFVAAGEESRLATRVPMRMCIADGARVLMSLRDPVAGTTSTTNILIDHSALAQCLTYAFETMWSQAKPVPVPAS